MITRRRFRESADFAAAIDALTGDYRPERIRTRRPAELLAIPHNQSRRRAVNRCQRRFTRPPPDARCTDPYNGARRTREIGIRVALGASTRDVVRLVGDRALLLAGIGLAAGLVAALAFAGLLRSQLWGVTPTDPVTFVAASLFLFAVCTLACALPTRRATSISPMVALRME